MGVFELIANNGKMDIFTNPRCNIKKRNMSVFELIANNGKMDIFANPRCNIKKKN